MKLCQILLFPVLLAFIDKVNSSSGCDLDSAIADGCSGLTECTLSNGYATGECCQPDHLCDLEEGDCDRDEDCDGNYICGTNNCGSPFPDSHDCCTRGNYFKCLFMKEGYRKRFWPYYLGLGVVQTQSSLRLDLRVF